MFRARAPALALLAVAPLAAASSSPSRAGSYSTGLGAAEKASSGSDVTLLRPAPEGRVHVGGGKFTMGASPAEMQAAFALCRAEPLGQASVQRVDPQTRTIFLQPLCDPHRFVAEGAAHEVTLSPFSIDRTEVRVRDYMRCVSAGRCAAPGFAVGDARFADPDFPVVLVSWDDAHDYCSFAHGRLPTEAEWELAARGIQQRVFPWGSVYNGHLCNHGSLGVDHTDASDGYARLAPVGSFRDGQTPLGLLDMAGNAAEWVDDEVDPDVSETFPPPYPAGPQVDPVSRGGARRVVRGGSYAEGAYEQRTTARRMEFRTTRADFIGFRCAASD